MRFVTIKLAFKDWGAVFPNAARVTSFIDRLTHHAEIFTLTGESYRRGKAQATQKGRRRTGERPVGSAPFRFTPAACSETYASW